VLMFYTSDRGQKQSVNTLPPSKLVLGWQSDSSSKRACLASEALSSTPVPPKNKIGLAG
jgi:hypothetical protein